MGSIFEDIRDCVVQMRISEIRNLVKKALQAGLPAYQIFTEGITRGMEVVGEKYEEGEYFLSELLAAGQAANEAMEELRPTLQKVPTKSIGIVVIGTVTGDMHDIGKNIVKMLMSSAGFDMFDLGVDVPPGRFIEKCKETGTNILAMSALLTTTTAEMKKVMDELRKTSLRDKVKVIIGGTATSEDYAREIGADAAARDASHGVRICKNWMERHDGSETNRTDSRTRQVDKQG